jgi:hypothetical protein
MQSDTKVKIITQTISLLGMFQTFLCPGWLLVNDHSIMVDWEDALVFLLPVPELVLRNLGGKGPYEGLVDILLEPRIIHSNCF